MCVEFDALSQVAVVALRPTAEPESQTDNTGEDSEAEPDIATVGQRTESTQITVCGITAQLNFDSFNEHVSTEVSAHGELE